MIKQKSIFAALALPALFLGCEGDTGPQGPEGPPGIQGDPGADGMVPPDFGDLMECAAASPTPGTLPPVGDEIAPPPASVGADVPATYFGPSPSQSNPRLIGPLQLLRAGTVDTDAGVVRLPLYEGRLTNVNGSRTWFVLTDTSDPESAAALGLNAAPKLAFADTGNGVREGAYETDANGSNVLVFNDMEQVDFSFVHSVTPHTPDAGNPNYFPPDAAQPGSEGSNAYTPLVRITNAGGHVYNAPVIAGDVEPASLEQYCDGNIDAAGYTELHDKVVSICPAGAEHPDAGTVTLRLTPGFSFGRPVLYLSLDASDLGAAALEQATFAPGLQDIPVGADDSAFSAIERIFVTLNGPVNGGEQNPQRQGLNSALRGEGGPLNVLGGIPTVANDYSPLWDINLGVWTDEAISRGYVARLTEEFQILGMVARGFITGPGGARYGSVGIIVNCPIVHRLL